MKKRYWLMGVALVLSIAVAGPSFVFASAQAQENTAPIETIADLPLKTRFALLKAQDERTKDNYEKAALILVEHLEKNPDTDHFLLRYHIGRNYSAAGNSEQAFKHLQAATRLEERFAHAWLMLGENAYTIERYDVAAVAFKKGFDCGEDKSAYLLYFAAAAHVLDGNPSLAIPLLEDLVSGKHGEPKLDWYRALISACLDLEDGARGKQAVGNMLKSFSVDPDAWRLAFQYAASTGDFQQAAVALTITSYLRPLTPEEEKQLGDVYSVIGIPAQASLHYKKAMNGSGTAEEFEQLASAYLASHDTKEAMQTLKQALEMKPTYRLWSLIGDLYYIEKDYAKSYEAFEKCMEYDDQQGRPYLMMGYCALELGNMQTAIQYLEKAVQFEDYQATGAALLNRAKAMSLSSHGSSAGG
jgi:tetratricopeptide (TPR) repeat protein